MQVFVKDKEFYKKIATIAIPVTLQSLINIGINMADTIMLGYFGESQLSASSLANQFLSLFHILCMGIGGGAAVMTAQYWGKEDILSLKKVITLMHRVIFTVAVFFYDNYFIFSRANYEYLYTESRIN
jgi:Na+-driven multidrug efflux pump